MGIHNVPLMVMERMTLEDDSLMSRQKLLALDVHFAYGSPIHSFC